MNALAQAGNLHPWSSVWQGLGTETACPAAGSCGIWGDLPPPMVPWGSNVGARWWGERLGTLPSCQAPARDCRRTELGVHVGHPCVQMPGSGVLFSWLGGAGAWGRGRDTGAAHPQSPTEPPHRSRECSWWDGCWVLQSPVQHLVPHRAGPGMPGCGGGTGGESWGPVGWRVPVVAPGRRPQAGRGSSRERPRPWPAGEEGQEAGINPRKGRLAPAGLGCNGWSRGREGRRREGNAQGLSQASALLQLCSWPRFTSAALAQHHPAGTGGWRLCTAPGRRCACPQSRSMDGMG